MLCIRDTSFFLYSNKMKHNHKFYFKNLVYFDNSIKTFSKLSTGKSKSHYKERIKLPATVSQNTKISLEKF